jgi:NAD(P)-dependent dehydrogenase (short-subunit alcohol dehydrogenase family)
MDLKLHGRVAIVTGGSRGIGYATAEEMLKEGVAVSICARDEGRLAEAKEELGAKTGGRIEAMRADVMNPDDIEAFTRETERQLGPVDILVNNAANYYDGDMVDMPDEYWDHHLTTKFKAYMRFVRRLAPGMRERGWGRIINLGGGAARRVNLGSGTAGPVNAAITTYTKYIATELAPYGIRVNLIHPGGARTQRREIAIRRLMERDGMTYEQVEHAMIANVPIGRMIEASDAARLIVFLCSESADAITGQTISVDGGADRAVNY